MDRLTIEYNGKTFETESYWWKDNDFIFVSLEGEQHRFTNPYPTSIRFGDLDYSSSESCNIELTQRYSKVPYAGNCSLNNELRDLPVD